MLDFAPFPPWLNRLFEVKPERRMVRVSGDVRMHVASWGDESGIPIVCIHGNPSWSFLWRRVAAELLRGTSQGECAVRILAPDLVGLGFSDKPARIEDHSLEAHIAWTSALLDALDVRDAVFVGQDWGGPIGLGAFAPRLDRLRAMVLMNTTIAAPKPGFRRTAFHRFSRVPIASDLVFRGAGFPQNAMAFTQGDRSSIRGDVARAYRYPLRRLRDRAAPLAMARMVPDTMRHPSIPALQRIDETARGFPRSVALVWGERDPVLGRSLKRMREIFPDAPVTRTSGGHFLQEEVPVEIARAVRSLL